MVWVRFLPALCFALVIFYFTHIPGQKVPGWMWRVGSDKVLHVLAYGGFCLFLLPGMDGALSSRLRAAAGTVAVAALLTAIDEITQSLTGRETSLRDFMASVAGGFIGTVSALFLLTWYEEWRRDRKLGFGTG